MNEYYSHRFKKSPASPASLLYPARLVTFLLLALTACRSATADDAPGLGSIGDGTPALSTREREIAVLAARGESNLEIARSLSTATRPWRSTSGRSIKSSAFLRAEHSGRT